MSFKAATDTRKKAAQVSIGLPSLTSQHRSVLPQPIQALPAVRERPLDDGLAEPGFDHDFSRIRAHTPISTDRAAPQPVAESCPLALASPRACPFGGVCHTCPVQVQPKLAVSQPGDKYEQEADRAAEQVMRMPEPEDRREAAVYGRAQNTRIQRKCACGQGAITSGECDACRQKREGTLQRHGANQTEPTSIPPIVHDVLRSPGQPFDPATRAFMEPRFGHDFSRVPLLSVVPNSLRSVGQAGEQHRWEADPMMEQGQKVNHAYSGESDCSPTWFGDTSPEVDPSGGSFTGRVVVKYNDAELKDPCVRECVEVHENVHVRQLTPVVKKIHDCDVAAGGDWEKKGKCNAMANRELNEPRRRWECEAYQRSFTCLTLKILDSKGPCSKSPHRDEVQKHRGYDACEMKRYCAEAGTPEAGIPNV